VRKYGYGEIADLPAFSQPEVSTILRGERPITAKHARRLGKRRRKTVPLCTRKAGQL
jgi:hypothetical protein